jgi:hypothetical protein
MYGQFVADNRFFDDMQHLATDQFERKNSEGLRRIPGAPCFSLSRNDGHQLPKASHDPSPAKVIGS